MTSPLAQFNPAKKPTRPGRPDDPLYDVRMRPAKVRVSEKRWLFGWVIGPKKSGFLTNRGQVFRCDPEDVTEA